MDALSPYQRHDPPVFVKGTDYYCCTRHGEKPPDVLGPWEPLPSDWTRQVEAKRGCKLWMAGGREGGTANTKAVKSTAEKSMPVPKSDDWQTVKAVAHRLDLMRIEAEFDVPGKFAEAIRLACKELWELAAKHEPQ